MTSNDQVTLELAKTRKIIRKKYRDLKNLKSSSNRFFSSTFAPIISPLQNIEKGVQDKKLPPETPLETPPPTPKAPPPTPETPQLHDETLQEIKFSTPQQSPIDETRLSDKNIGPLGRRYIDFMIKKNHDTVYGPHVDEFDVLKFGDFNLKLTPQDDIIIGENSWAGTAGLFDLIFNSHPQTFDSTDLANYQKILKITRKHLRSDNRLKSNMGYKYKNIVRDLFIKKTEPKKGGSLMNLNQKPVEYVYWNDVNELVDRLIILVGESRSGHDAHRNEILSIIEELCEQNVIKRPHTDILNSL